MAAVSGTARTMPTAPPIAPPATMPTSESAGWILTADCMTSGDSTLSVTFCATIVITSVQNAHSGLTKRPRRTAETEESIGPTTGMKCRTNVAMPSRPA